MRTIPGEGFRDKNAAEQTLEVLRRRAGDKLKKAEIEPTLMSHPGDEFFQISFIYHDPEKTPRTVRGEIKSPADVFILEDEGCIHEYSLGTYSDNVTREYSSLVTCHACHGEVKLDIVRVISFILQMNGNHLGYERWEKQPS